MNEVKDIDEVVEIHIKELVEIHLSQWDQLEVQPCSIILQIGGLIL